MRGMCRITSVMPMWATSSAFTTRRMPSFSMRRPPRPKKSAPGARRRISSISMAPYCSPLASPAERKIFGPVVPVGSTLIRAHGQFLVFVLQLVQLPVNAALAQQFLVGAELTQLALVHHQDPVGLLNSREPM